MTDSEGSLSLQSIEIRPISPNSAAEIELVAARMRRTLIDVLGEEVGGSMYSMEWLIERAKFHLDPSQCDGQIFLAELSSGEIVGHTIVRVEREERNAESGEAQTNNQQPTTKNDSFGLFSTFYVLPEFRGNGIASQFIEIGEKWMLSMGMPIARTYTAEDNELLHRLMIRHGYEIELRKNEMVSLMKNLV